MSECGNPGGDGGGSACSLQFPVVLSGIKVRVRFLLGQRPFRERPERKKKKEEERKKEKKKERKKKKTEKTLARKLKEQRKEIKR
jgi:hypothetical protein